MPRFCKDCVFFHVSDDWNRMRDAGMSVSDQHLEYGTCSNPKYYTSEPKFDMVTGKLKRKPPEYASVRRNLSWLCGKEGSGFKLAPRIKDASSGIYEVEPLMIEGTVEKKQWWKKVF